METPAKESTPFSSHHTGEPTYTTNGHQTPTPSPSFSDIKSVDDLKAWAKEHPQTATLGAFAVGVFIGVLLRR